MKELKNMMKSYRKVKRYSNKIGSYGNKLNRSVNKISQSAGKTTKKKTTSSKSAGKSISSASKPIKYKGVSIDHMTGHQFEQFLADLYRDLGYKVKKTDPTGDFGADLILKSKDDTRVIQAKRYSQKVGVRAIQEISTSQRYYNANSTAVVTSNYFTRAALELASINDVILIDRDSLIGLISKRDKLKSGINNTDKGVSGIDKSRGDTPINNEKQNKLGFLDRMLKKLDL